ncbi:MAG: hypothetical protein ACRD2F_08585, partial [Terriglobales bacterium]
MASLQPSPAAPPAAAFPSRRGWLWWVAAAVGVYAALLAAHWPLLHLPYYWDEAGYFVPAALDLFRHGWWIPRTTLANGHPPLLMAALALAWRVGGVGIAVSRCTVLIFAAALVLGTARLAGMLAGRRAAWIAALWLAVMPLCFAQATLVQLDLPAAAWAVWALVAWASGRRWIYAALAAAACLTKETAILIPLVLGVGALARWLRRRDRIWPALGPHVLAALPLIAWFACYHAATGYWMGNAGFLAYNLHTALSLPRIGMALALRIWQLAGYDGMAAITVAALLALWLRRHPGLGQAHGVPGPAGAASGLGPAPVDAGRAAQPRWGPRPSIELWAIVAAYVVFHAWIGGAVLDRYLLPAIALYIVLLAPAVAGVRHAGLRRAIVTAVAAWLVAGWLWNPPYPFPFEDNLAYATFVRLQQQAVRALVARAPALPVLTAWPATNELTDPSLGYLRRPIAVAPVESFSASALRGRRLAPGQYALLYMRVY